MSYYPVTYEFQLVEALRALFAYGPAPTELPKGDPYLWEAQESERKRAEAFSNAIMNLVKRETSILQSKLEIANNERMALQGRITFLESSIAGLQAKNNDFDKEQQRFMKACVCVKLNQEPNRPPET